MGGSVGRSVGCWPGHVSEARPMLPPTGFKPAGNQVQPRQDTGHTMGDWANPRAAQVRKTGRKVRPRRATEGRAGAKATSKARQSKALKPRKAMQGPRQEAQEGHAEATEGHDGAKTGSKVKKRKQRNAKWPHGGQRGLCRSQGRSPERESGAKARSKAKPRGGHRKRPRKEAKLAK